MLTRRRAVTGMAAVAGIAAVDVGGFLYTGGWADTERFDTIPVRRPVRTGVWASRWLQTEPRQGPKRDRNVRQQRRRRCCEQSLGVHHRDSPCDRPVFTLRWPPRSGGQTRHGPRFSAGVPVTKPVSSGVPPWSTSPSFPTAPRRVSTSVCWRPRPCRIRAARTRRRWPPFCPAQNISVFAVQRLCHTIFAYLLFLTFTAHMCAVLFHTFVLRDRMIDRMALWPAKAQRPQHDRDSTTTTVAPDRDSPAPSASPSP